MSCRAPDREAFIASRRWPEQTKIESHLVGRVRGLCDRAVVGRTPNRHTAAYPSVRRASRPGVVARPSSNSNDAYAACAGGC